MKKILFFLFGFHAIFMIAQEDKIHKNLINKERKQALSKLLYFSNKNNNQYDIKYHRLILSPSLSNKQLSGEVTTYFVANQDIAKIDFDLNDQMTVVSVKQRNNNLNFSQSNNKLTINFPVNISSGTLDSLTIQYNGIVPDNTLGSYTVTSHNSTPIIWTLSEPYGARDWWPCKQDLTDKIDSIDITIKYNRYYNNEEMQAVSNGIISNEYVIYNSSTTPSEIKVTTWKHRYPIAYYLIAFAITNYNKFSQAAGINQQFPIDNYVFPENLNDIQSLSNNFVPVMNFFEQKFGHYPFNKEKYGQIQFGWGGGMEHQTATFLVNYNRSLVAHELAHQWFGDAITCASWHDIWINESFATYAEALTIEEFDGKKEFENWKKNTISYITTEPNGSVYVQDTTNIWRIFDSRLSYKKGAMMLNMLRIKIGDSNFFQGLKNYVNHKSFKNAFTTDFQIEMENQSKQKLNTFFNNWIYGEGYPSYNILVSKTANHQYDITINQTTSDDSVNFFELPLPFLFKDENGNTYETILENTYNEQVFHVDPGFEITQAIFDPHYDIIKGDTSINLILNNKFLSQTKFKIFPNPSNKYIKIQNKNNLEISQIIIFDFNGKIIQQKNNKLKKLNISKLSNGTYFLKIITNKGYYIHKFIKK